MSYERDYTPIPPPVPAWRARLALYWQLVRGDRPIGWLLLLWPTWWGLWLAAGGVPPLWTLVVFTAGVWLTRPRSSKRARRAARMDRDRPVLTISRHPTRVHETDRRTCASDLA